MAIVVFGLYVRTMYPTVRLPSPLGDELALFIPHPSGWPSPHHRSQVATLGSSWESYVPVRITLVLTVRRLNLLPHNQPP